MYCTRYENANSRKYHTGMIDLKEAETKKLSLKLAARNAK